MSITSGPISFVFLFPDAPTVEAEQTFIHTRENDETEVVCVVHSSPKAEVTWYKNGKPLLSSEGIVSDRGNRHTLLLPGIRQSTFGEYRCRAENKFGFDERTTEVSGEALDFVSIVYAVLLCSMTFEIMPFNWFAQAVCFNNALMHFQATFLYLRP